MVQVGGRFAIHLGVRRCKAANSAEACQIAQSEEIALATLAALVLIEVHESASE